MWLCGLRKRKAKYSSVSYQNSSDNYEASPGAEPGSSQPSTSTSTEVGASEKDILAPSLAKAGNYGTAGTVTPIPSQGARNGGDHLGRGSHTRDQSQSLQTMSTPTEDGVQELMSPGGAQDAFKTPAAARSQLGIKEGAEKLLFGEEKTAICDILVFDAARTVLYSNLASVDDRELPAIASLFAGRDKAMMKGITLEGQRYEVHRFHPPLVYGRTATKGEDESVGIALCKTSAAEGEMTVFALMTYKMPALSARMVPLLQRFCKETIEPLQQWWFIN
ncbi:hypothetical protein HOP50_09g53890 [Chloropicon primus]|uniref:Profilin n=1 Tax=Chloropicon primus TaxID=1764295 RepID=A0A5B8MR35_9CHLO|nr:hypothetical protein A3770_09p53590 [Chloropicon primus]UPR02065.1 hypothetical protein HOP50_09g53890 [Chloropicon primus]|eukprot:QDZ22841.1 hypothetical protein A3770_09p53590 [Chloropicon primus]